MAQMGNMFSADDMLSATDFTELNDFLNSSGDFGPYFTGDMFNPNLLSGFMPSRESGR